MKLWKKLLAGVLVTALIGGAGAGGLYYMRQSRQREVKVVSVGSLAEEYYSQDTMLEGYVATNVSQQISVDDDMVIQEVYVQEGDSVEVGDTLVTFDMTLVEMELNIARLKKQKQEQDLNNASRRLTRLKNGGPIDESDGYSPGTADDLSGMEDYEEAYAGGLSGGSVLASAMPPLFLSMAFTDDTLEGDISEGEDPGDIEEEFDPGGGITFLPEEDPEPDPGTGEDDGFVIGGGDEVLPTPVPVPDLPPDVEFLNPEDQEENPYFLETPAVFYDTLDGSSKPFTGTGTQWDPYIFLCSSAKGMVTVKGSFFNKMAGYTEDGSTLLKKGGYWYQLEFHQYDTITNYADRRESCIGYYLMDGGLLEKPAGMSAFLEFTVEEASQYELPGDEEPPLDDLPGDDVPVISRAEAIKLQESIIASLQLDIQESDINIEKLEKKVERKVIYSKLDGTVSYVGDVLTGTAGGGNFMTIKSKEGYYVTGVVSELMLDQMKEGTLLSCMSYSSGSFEAKVMDVSDYPTSANAYFGEGNPNVSYYTYSASILDDSIELQDMDWLTVTLKNQKVEEGSVILSKAFVRSENGKSYVYKDDGGVLKKQYLSVGGNVNGGYSVLIKQGVTKEDLVAFPYGDDVVEGAKTTKVTLDQFYGY